LLRRGTNLSLLGLAANFDVALKALGPLEEELIVPFARETDATVEAMTMRVLSSTPIFHAVPSFPKQCQKHKNVKVTCSSE